MLSLNHFICMGGVPLTRALNWTLEAGMTSCDGGFSTKVGGSTKRVGGTEGNGSFQNDYFFFF